MKALIVGGDSKLGLALSLVMKSRNMEYLCTTRRSLLIHPEGGHMVRFDMMSPDTLSVPAVDVVFILAAITKVVDCEADPVTAWRINADAPVAIARQFASLDSHIVFLSSDAVERAPNLVYSRAKAYAELALMPMGASIVRSSMLGTAIRFDALSVELLNIARYRTKGVIRWS